MRRLFHVTAVAGALVLALGACGSQKDTGFNKLSTPKATGGGGGGATEIKLVTGNAFSPKTFNAKVGQKVTWDNTDTQQPHNVVSDAGLFNSNPDCVNDQTKCMAEGPQFSFTFDKAGSYPYYCQIHGSKGGNGMAGVVVVA
ncbi:MAG: plastocyanin/azurin family copper-binding protein [Actinomycetota bacterium]|nr:cupredoxin domain-containing protein [Actinomycetota bacterium]